MQRIIKRNNALKIEVVAVSDVRPHSKNVRLHDQDNLDAIKASLEAFGQMKPIVVWRDNQIIAGCGTHEAATQLHWPTIQIVRVDHLSENAAMEYLIADNKTTDMSTFDFEQLGILMKDLRTAGADLASSGFSEVELEPLIEGSLFKENAETQEERPADVKHNVSFNEEEWASLVERFLHVNDMDKSVDEPKAFILLACKSYKHQKRVIKHGNV